MLNKKKMILIISFGVVCVILFNVFVRSVNSNVDEYISPASDKITYDDVKDYLKKIDYSRVKESGIFEDKIVNKHTIKFFKHMQVLFKDKSFDEHLIAIKEYLLTMMSPEEAERVLQLYKKFIDYENDVAALVNSSGRIGSEEDFLRLLQKIKKVQVKYFGSEDAVILFGAELKAQEYPLRRKAIINDTGLYGKEKEEKIAKLNQEMWGNQASEFEDSRKPYVKYQDKLNIYDKDLKEMSESERIAKIKDFRESIFPPDVVQRLEELDQQIVFEEQRDQEYKVSSDQINSDESLTASEKQEKITELQNATYGDQADSVRRVEEMEKRKKELLKKYKN